MLIDPRKALVVDDEVLISLHLEDILQSHGYGVTVVNARHQLQPALEQGPYDLAVVDTGIFRPEDADRAAVKRMILCSGQTDDRILCAYAGVPMIRKPFTDSDFDVWL